MFLEKEYQENKEVSSFEETEEISEKEKLISSLEKWIKHIEEENLIQTIDIKEFKFGKTLVFSPFHFKCIKKNRLFLRTNNEDEIFIFIGSSKWKNNIVKKQLKEGTQDERYIIELKKLIDDKKCFRLTTEQEFFKYYAVKESNKENDSDEVDWNIKITKRSRTSKKAIEHLNNVWGIEEKDQFKTFKLDEFQQKAYETSLQKNLSIIIGRAGTGKSATIKMISNKLFEEGWKVSRVAPTGRAAQIINGKTIHSWLEPKIIEVSKWKVEIAYFLKKSMENKECLIVDEASMIDNYIWEEIYKVWAGSKHIENKKIIFVGDTEQLEPVGEGRPFIEAVRNNTFPFTELQVIHRNKENNDIIDLAEFVRQNGNIPLNKIFSNVEYISEKEAIEKLINNSSHQIIMPHRNGDNGTLEFNKKYKKMLNKKEKPEFYTLVWDNESGFAGQFVEEAPIHLKDKIIINKNLWEWNITNGTTGIFLGEERVKLFNHIKKDYSSNRNCYKFQNLDTEKIFYLPANNKTRACIELAYAITIHKAQGSEYKNPILMYDRIRNKKMLYTAITRAQEKLYIASLKIK